MCQSLEKVAAKENRIIGRSRIRQNLTHNLSAGSQWDHEG
jgi:hypothetical protein